MNLKFEIQNLMMEDVKIITPFYMEDDRGYFLKSFEKELFRSLGLQIDIYEDFESYSKKNVLRGLHFQICQPQKKLVRVIKGEIHDVIVDLRKNSKTFGKSMDIILSEDIHNMLWIPAGFAHGFEVLSTEAIMSYKCFGKYLKEYDSGIRWNDADLSIQWQTSKPILSEKDAALMSFQEFKEHYFGL